MDFKFVNITEPSQSRDPTVLKGVRQHVQKPGRKKVSFRPFNREHIYILMSC